MKLKSTLFVRLKSTLKFMFYLFCIITTAQVLFISILRMLGILTDQLVNSDLYSILVTAFVGVLPTIMFTFTDKENLSRAGWLISRLIHFLLTISLIFISLNYFGSLKGGRTFPIAILFFIIYFSAHLYQEIRTRQTADELNRRINATHKD